MWNRDLSSTDQLPVACTLILILNVWDLTRKCLQNTTLRWSPITCHPLDPSLERTAEAKPCSLLKPTKKLGRNLPPLDWIFPSPRVVNGKFSLDAWVPTKTLSTQFPTPGWDLLPVIPSGSCHCSLVKNTLEMARCPSISQALRPSTTESKNTETSTITVEETRWTTITMKAVGGTCINRQGTRNRFHRNRWLCSPSGRSIRIPGSAMERRTGTFAGLLRKHSTRRRVSMSWGWTIGVAIALPIGAIRGVRTDIGMSTWTRSTSQARPLVVKKMMKEILKLNKKVHELGGNIVKRMWSEMLKGFPMMPFGDTRQALPSHQSLHMKSIPMTFRFITRESGLRLLGTFAAHLAWQYPIMRLQTFHYITN